MLEKFKDILYDLTDFALVVLIIVIMTTVISIKITDAMSVNLLSIFDNTPAEAEVIVNVPENFTDDTEDDIEEIIIKPEFNETADNETSQDVDPNEGNEESDTTEIETNKEVTIIIESGSTGYAIAKKLRDNELIADTSIFTSRVEDLKLGAKLQSGTFVLSTTQSLDDMIYTLAGQR